MLEKLNPWHPIDNKVDLKHLGKLGEETNELGSVVSRCIIQGVDGVEPTTGKANRRWLEEEIADVKANIKLVEDRFSLDVGFIDVRMQDKIARLKTWHDMA